MDKLTLLAGRLHRCQRALTSHLPRNRGFSLIELIIVIAILGIAMGIGTPTLSTLSQNQRVKSGVADLQFSMLYARSEAIKRGANAYVFPVGNSWANGWQVCADSLCKNTLRIEATLANRLQATQDPAASATNVIYGSDGRLAPGGPSFIRFAILGATDASARCVNLSLSGNPSVAIDQDTNSSNGC